MASHRESNGALDAQHERYARYPSLVGRAVLITGGATGIGASFVEHFARQGARVAFVDLDEKAGRALVARLADAAHEPVFVVCDLTDIGALRGAIDAIRVRIGPIAVLVNNAANDVRHAVADVTPESFDASIAVNLRHQFFAAQAVIDDMKRLGGGAIVNLGSIGWMLKNAGYPVYATAKAAVQGLTRALARELRAVRHSREHARAGLGDDRQATPLVARRCGPRGDQGGQCIDAELLPGDLARMALFLAADDSRLITAQDVVVDGGWA